MTECKHCEHFDLFTNECLIDNSKGYENKVCLHYNCAHYEDAKWCPSFSGYTEAEGSRNDTTES